MKVAVFTGIRDLEVCERPMPVLERPGDVLLQIETVGVCGSDIHYYTEGRIGGQVIEHPATLGHECAGTVVEVNSQLEEAPELVNESPYELGWIAAFQPAGTPEGFLDAAGYCKAIA